MTQTQHKTDHELKLAIDSELDWAPNVKADRVGVSVHDGAVTLSGQVDTYPEKEAAVRAAFRVHGVTAVADEIVVEHTWGPRDDTDIAREAGAALERSVVVPQNSVKATVHDHVVTLTGAVPWRYQREAARHAVSNLPGVTGVLDQVVITPAMTISAAKAKSKITSALVRNAQLDANRITVGVHGSVVTLTGTVSSWAERRQAEHAAWSAPGVTGVTNQITVCP
jgi:osmotically-inducible protein OsmY